MIRNAKYVIRIKLLKRFSVNGKELKGGGALEVERPLQKQGWECARGNSVSPGRPAGNWLFLLELGSWGILEGLAWPGCKRMSQASLAHYAHETHPGKAPLNTTPPDTPLEGVKNYFR